MRASKAEVQARIRQAFSGVPLPRSGGIVRNSRHPEERDIAERLRGRTWDSLSPRELFFHAASLSFFTPEALRYYLPAYLVAVLDGYEADVVYDSLLYKLSPLTYENGEVFRGTFSGLTAEQREVIGEVLTFIAGEVPSEGDDPVFVAARRFWAVRQTPRDT